MHILSSTYVCYCLKYAFVYDMCTNMHLQFLSSGVTSCKTIIHVILGPHIESLQGIFVLLKIFYQSEQQNV